MHGHYPVAATVNVTLCGFVQEAAISVFSSIKKYIDDETMKRLVLPKAKALFLKSTNVRVCENTLFPPPPSRPLHVMNTIVYIARFRV